MLLQLRTRWSEEHRFFCDDEYCRESSRTIMVPSPELRIKGLHKILLKFTLLSSQLQSSNFHVENRPNTVPSSGFGLVTERNEEPK